ncbi:hypothetical protein DVH24_014750 [Malus domestica]|uniref:Symplekin C-terminal domain-containing protein n=1 Tax=Malus domestica TaxID=3750 RepID=A0A498K1C9_MALDO|nr:hypothetical protein DVH24_014750 [Malus domestica]
MRLFGEAEEERDFFSSTTATSVYEMFLSTAVETLRDSFPPSDKSLSRWLGEVPYLPDSVLKLLECMCSPGNCGKTQKETQGGDRVTQGLSIVWSLILLRPPLRYPCLKIALQSAVHRLEEVRMKVICLVLTRNLLFDQRVANKLYPLSSIAQRIEDFAIEIVDATEKIDAEGSKNELQKDSDSDKHSNGPPSVSGNSKDISSDNHQSCSSQSVSSPSIAEAQRCLSLYFALCTKAVHRQIPILVRTMGLSPNLLEIISDPPTGSENLLMQVLHTLTDGIVPSQELIFTVRKLYDSKLKDVEILIPILPFLLKDEVMLIFPHLVNLQLDKFQAALACTLQVTDACNACFEQRQIFTQQVIAKVLNQLVCTIGYFLIFLLHRFQAERKDDQASYLQVEQIPLPLLVMRTVLQAIVAFPALAEILSRPVSKQIWKYPKLWLGFLKCAFLTKPQSFAVLLQILRHKQVGLKPRHKQVNLRPRHKQVSFSAHAETQTSQPQAEAQKSQSQYRSIYTPFSRSIWSSMS